MSVIDDKDPVGNGKGGVDGGDDDGADFLDLLLGSALPHALHQLGHSPLPDDKEDGEDTEERPDVKVGDVGHLDSNADGDMIHRNTIFDVITLGI